MRKEGWIPSGQHWLSQCDRPSCFGNNLQSACIYVYLPCTSCIKSNMPYPSWAAHTRMTPTSVWVAHVLLTMNNCANHNLLIISSTRYACIVTFVNLQQEYMTAIAIASGLGNFYLAKYYDHENSSMLLNNLLIREERWIPLVNTG